MTRSDSSDSGRSRKHKKKSKHRSRSESSSSEERSRKSRKHKSDRRKDDHRRSRSRDRSRDRRRSRSRDRKRSRSRSRERKRSRSRSRSKSPPKPSGWDETSKPQTKQNSSGWDAKQSDDKLTLKEKIKLLTGKSDQTETITPSLEQIGKIENENFVQEKFSSTYIDPSAQPKQKKKKKNKQKQVIKINEEHENDTKSEQQQQIEPVSHEDAMFGSTMDTLHVTKFSKGLDGKQKSDLITAVSEDSIFGAMFFDDPEVRRKRWINKLTKLRNKLVEEE